MSTERDRRYELDDKLRELLPTDWHLYFQPPENVKLIYPALIYSRTSGDTKFADNSSYMYTRQYELTFIYEDPDDETSDFVVSQLEYCRMNRHFVQSNLNHDTAVLYF